MLSGRAEIRSGSMSETRRRSSEYPSVVVSQLVQNENKAAVKRQRIEIDRPYQVLKKMKKEPKTCSHAMKPPLGIADT